MVTKALSNQHLWPKSFCRFPLNYLQSFHCFMYTPFYFYSYSRQVIFFVCFMLSQYGNLQTRESPSPLFSLWHCCFCIWFFLVFVLGALDWSYSCHQQHSVSKKCQILRKQKDLCACVDIFNGWKLFWNHSASKMYLLFSGCFHTNTVLSKGVHSLFWCRISPAFLPKPSPLSHSKADSMTKKTLVLTNFVCPPFWLPRKYPANVTDTYLKVEEIKHI